MKKFTLSVVLLAALSATASAGEIPHPYCDPNTQTCSETSSVPGTTEPPPTEEGTADVTAYIAAALTSLTTSILALA